MKGISVTIILFLKFDPIDPIVGGLTVAAE